MMACFHKKRYIYVVIGYTKHFFLFLSALSFFYLRNKRKKKKKPYKTLIMDKKFDPDQESSRYVLGESVGTSVHEIDPVEDSPIEEVRSAVPPTDDPTLPTATFRAWFWGIIFSCCISFSNQVSILSFYFILYLTFLKTVFLVSCQSFNH